MNKKLLGFTFFVGLFCFSFLFAMDEPLELEIPTEEILDLPDDSFTDDEREFFLLLENADETEEEILEKRASKNKISLTRTGLFTGVGLTSAGVVAKVLGKKYKLGKLFDKGSTALILSGPAVASTLHATDKVVDKVSEVGRQLIEKGSKKIDEYDEKKDLLINNMVEKSDDLLKTLDEKSKALVKKLKEPQGILKKFENISHDTRQITTNVSDSFDKIADGCNVVLGVVGKSVNLFTFSDEIKKDPEYLKKLDEKFWLKEAQFTNLENSQMFAPDENDMSGVRDWKIVYKKKLQETREENQNLPVYTDEYANLDFFGFTKKTGGKLCSLMGGFCVQAGKDAGALVGIKWKKKKKKE